MSILYITHTSTSSRIGPLTFSFGIKEGGRFLSRMGYLQGFLTVQVTNIQRVLFSSIRSSLVQNVCF